MAERKDKEPVFGKLDELDEDTAIPSGLRAESKGRDSDGASGAAGGEDTPRAETVPDPEPAVSAAISLTTRTRPDETELDASGSGNPGAAMRAARDRLGLEASALAFRTRLPQRVIENLEANRFESMAPAYVKGYLRAVAKELDDDADRWIRAYESLGYTESTPRATVQRDSSDRWTSNSLAWYWIAAVIVVSVLGLGVYAWTDGTRTNPLSGLMVWFGSDERLSVPDDRSPGPEQIQPPESEPAEEIDWVSDPVTFGMVSDPLTLELEAERSNDDLVAEPGAVASPGATLPLGETATNASVVPEGEYVLTFSFEATSWVEVRSPGDQVQLRGIFHSGDRQTATVELPARIVLGNAPAVRLERDGEAVDLTPHTRADSTARFSLGTE